ncbi:hypothetical protein JL722_5630 [Aureococcus anophagefferens]|nr:hypothetical protein JL722_5630 [Aureococcus anophagefferens]
MYPDGAPSVFVTGGSSGIGYALCRSLALDHGFRVFMGCRDGDAGSRAAMRVEDEGAYCENIEIDVTDDDACETAAVMVQSLLGFEPLTCLVNCAAVGHATCSDGAKIVDVNLRGAKRVCDAFLPIMDERFGRVVNVGAGGGAGYVETCEDVARRLLTSPDVRWDDVEAYARGALAAEVHDDQGYGLSKACLAAFTLCLAREHPKMLSVTAHPGVCGGTKMNPGAADRTAEDGAKSVAFCLLAERLKLGNGFLYGPDGLRSPLFAARDACAEQAERRGSAADDAEVVELLPPAKDARSAATTKPAAPVSFDAAMRGKLLRTPAPAASGASGAAEPEFAGRPNEEPPPPSFVSGERCPETTEADDDVEPAAPPEAKEIPRGPFSGQPVGGGAPPDPEKAAATRAAIAALDRSLGPAPGATRLPRPA